MRTELINSTDETVITNVLTGKPARGIPNRFIKQDVGSPIRRDVPKFPNAASLLLDLRNNAEKQGKTDYTSMWAGEHYQQVFSGLKKRYKDISYLKTKQIIDYFFP